ncbi:FAD-binding protein [Auraticoccus sp. F435]|uniref:FAD-binding protein n=1 Tax=Auraticoccus cholistanensis TaxID=2656650 RepID=A0A6A9V0K4_9ACTN|nr:NAD(P)/FAD-dependent oxidoreductase [Auraticoccus cholistanensis]MVA75769.1 FAD-binding protein [Auraticoccus cholistanensis]
MDTTHDVVIVGGGPAGLSAAVALARSLRRTVVVDAGEARNAPAAHAHNLLGREAVPPLELLAEGRREAERYGAEVVHDRAVAAGRDGDVLTVRLAGGRELRARRLVLATGLVDGLPELPGVREHWGSDVLHCPYCHGYEFRDRRLLVLGRDERSVHQALLFRQVSPDVTLLRHTMPEIDEDELEMLAARDVEVVDGAVARLRTEDGRLAGVELEDGRVLPADGVVVAPTFSARTELFEQLGGVATPHPMGGTFIHSEGGRTDVPGVWAVGNASNLSAMVASSSAEGLLAGAMINAELVEEDVRAAREQRAAAPVAAHAG